MRLLVIVLASCFLRTVQGQEFTLVRHFDGDIFTLEGSCKEACAVLSSGTASPYSSSPSTAGLVGGNTSCTCQCNVGLPTFREDLRICVNDIHECKVAGFVNAGQVERVPYVFLPQHGQIIYPDAEIRFEGVTTPICSIAGAQQLGRAGWFELRNLSDAQPPFRLFLDEGKMFLRWVGESGLREAAEGRVVIAKLACRDAAPKTTDPNIFTHCVAFRVAGSPSKNNVREVTFSSSSRVSQGLSATEYTAIGLSSVILALIYVATVSLYLHSRKAKRKPIDEPEATLPGTRDTTGLVKNNPLLAATASRHFESDTNSALTESDLGDDLPLSDSEQGNENRITSAVIHPHCIHLEYSENVLGAGSILGERLPEEDVRVVETVDSPHQLDAPVLPGAQRRKLYFNPAYFDRQLLLAPPPAAIEFLLKIREVISIAKHKMAAKKFVPTLVGIPEEENGSDRCGPVNKQRHKSSTSNSLQGSTTRSRKSRGCTGCPGCSNAESLQNLPALPEGGRSTPGESKVRAWLEDVRLPRRRWTETEESYTTRTFAKSLEYLKEIAKRDFDETIVENAPSITRSIPAAISSWQNNPPMLRTFQNIARSEIIGNDEDEDRYSISRRSTKSMLEESEYNRYRWRRRKDGTLESNGNETVNAKVRKAIENSFKQMEENTEKKVNQETKQKNDPLRDQSTKDDLDSSTKASSIDRRGNSNDEKESPPRTLSSQRKIKKTKRTPEKSLTPRKDLLPDMINELPNAKNTAKRIMDAVIREMVDVKALEHHSRSPRVTEYEVDSLERSKSSRKSSTSPESIADHSSPALSTALPMDEELTMQNAVITARTAPKREILEKNYYNVLPELITSQRSSKSYSLVSEVYVNDGYASPEGSEDSGPEIQYEPENPGHLTIKVQDSPQNYIKQDESEYEPDTLDRKPMKLKINGDVNYDKEADEVYVDSLERPTQILLRSKGSFRDDGTGVVNNDQKSVQRGYGSLREIYEARLKSNSMGSPVETEDKDSWKNSKYLAPDSRQAKRQRQPSHNNRPDVVPLPPNEEEIYQRPKPPRRVENVENIGKEEPLSLTLPKNAWDRSSVEAGDPAAGVGTPVLNYLGDYHAGNERTCSCGQRSFNQDTLSMYHEHVVSNEINNKKIASPSSTPNAILQSSIFHKVPLLTSKWNPGSPNDREEVEDAKRWRRQRHSKRMKIEDSGYLSSTDSNGSRKRLLARDNVSETDETEETEETESVCDGASESGAESIGTDSVFFGNVSSFSKSIDSGLDLPLRNPYLLLNDANPHPLERTNLSASDSETESFVTVLPPNNGSRTDSFSSFHRSTAT